MHTIYVACGWKALKTAGQHITNMGLLASFCGATETITDAAGTVVWDASYEAYGKLVHENGTVSFKASFTGKQVDADTGLYYFNARWYDAELGRFVTEDPARDGSNWYEYSGNNPLKYTDPDGRESVKSWIGRNWTNVVSVSLSTIEVAGGAALTSTSIGAVVGVPMMIHGAANIAAEVGKMTAITVVANI
jgi:RHS repeat-associated protein